jgi:hypothetical protein
MRKFLLRLARRPGLALPGYARCPGARRRGAVQVPGNSTYRAAFEGAQDRPHRRKPNAAIRPTGCRFLMPIWHSAASGHDFMQTANYAGRRAALRYACRKEVNGCK